MSDSSATPTPAPATGTSAANTPPARPAPQRENLLLNILFNIAAPSLILSWLSEPRHWKWLAGLLGSGAFNGPDEASAKTFAAACGLILALLFPVIYGLYDLVTRKKTNFISILGFFSVLLTGGMGLLKADGMWFAVKEASIPLLIGAMVLITQRTKRPLVREFLYNDQVIDTARIEAALAEKGTKADFEKLLASSSYLLALGFLISACLNFGLARYLLVSPAGTPEFNTELGRMNALSWPVIVLPTMLITVYALWRLLKGVQTLSGLSFDDLLQPQPEAKKPGEKA